MRKIILALVIVAVFTGCNIDYLEEALNSYEDDAADLIITWNADNSIRTAKDPETDEVIWYETWEYDGSSNPILVRRYSPEDRLKWSTLYKWEGGLKVQEVCYDSADNLLWHSVFTYNASGLILSECNYDDANLIQWFDVYEYTGTLNINRARYNSSSEMIHGFVWVYDSSDRKTKETHYTGNTSRNSAGLSYPDLGSIPTSPAFSLTGLSVSDWSMWSYDSFGFLRVKFDGDNFPLKVYRDDSRMARDLNVEIEYYSGHLPKSKLTRYGSDDVLLLELEYNSSGYLSEINTSGEALLIPLRYEIAYKSDLSIEKLSVYNSDTLLMYFTYSSAVNTDLTVHPLDPIGFTGSNYTLTQYDGDDVKLGSYVVSMVDSIMKIQALTAADTPNGYYLAHIDTKGEVASFECWSETPATLQWSYEYDYSEIAGKIMRTAEEKYDEYGQIIEEYTSIDMTNLTIDMLFN